MTCVCVSAQRVLEFVALQVLDLWIKGVQPDAHPKGIFQNMHPKYAYQHVCCDVI